MSAMFCEGCGQPSIATTKAGRPICADCSSEGYGDEPDRQQSAQGEVVAIGYGASYHRDADKWMVYKDNGDAPLFCVDNDVVDSVLAELRALCAQSSEIAQLRAAVAELVEGLGIAS